MAATRLRAVMRKEFRHILRDNRSLTVVFVLPVLMIFFYGYSLSFDLEQVRLALINHSSGELAKLFVERISSNKVFNLIKPDSRQEVDSEIALAEKMLRRGEIHAYLVIPADFSSGLLNDRQTEIGLVVDGSDTNVANLIMQKLEQARVDFILDWKKIPDLIFIRTHIFFNPEVKSYFYFIPGLVAVLLMMISSLLTSISIVREKESGSIELLFISPLRSGEIILGKTIPYILVAFSSGVLVLAFAHFWFGIPFRGSPLVLAFFSFIYLCCGLAFGILISTVSQTQRMAMIFSILATMLPSILLSGFIFPPEAMSVPIRLVSALVPATYYLRIIRGVFVKGAGMVYFLQEGAVLLLMGVFLLWLAVRKFTRLRREKA